MSTIRNSLASLLVLAGIAAWLPFALLAMVMAITYKACYHLTVAMAVLLFSPAAAVATAPAFYRVLDRIKHVSRS